ASAPQKYVALSIPSCPTSGALLWDRKARERAAVEGTSLPRRLVPGLLVADHLDGHDDSITSELVGRSDSVVEFPVGIHLKLDRPRQVADQQRFHLVVAGIFAQRKVGIVPFVRGWSCRIHPQEL